MINCLFIDDKILCVKPGHLHITPVEIILHDAGLIVLPPGRGIAPLALTRDGSGIRVQKVFVPVEYQALLRVVGAVYPVGILEIFYVQLEHDHRVYVADPVVVREWQNGKGFLLGPVKQKQFNRSSPVRIYGKINTSRNRRSAVDLIESGPYFKTADDIQRNHMYGTGKI